MDPRAAAAPAAGQLAAGAGCTAKQFFLFLKYKLAKVEDVLLRSGVESLNILLCSGVG